MENKNMPAKSVVVSLSKSLKIVINPLLKKLQHLSINYFLTGVSADWLQNYMNEKYEKLSRKVNVKKKSKRRLTIECDGCDVLSLPKCGILFKTKVKNLGYGLLQMLKCADCRCLCWYTDKQTAPKLRDSLPPVYRQCAVVYTTSGKPACVFPSKHHHAVGGKETGLTNHI